MSSWLWLLVIVAGLAALAAGLAWMDRRSRARGHRLRGGTSATDIADVRRDLRAGRETEWMSRDRSWLRDKRKDPPADAS